MSELMSRIAELSNVCDEIECELIEQMVFKAGEYVCAVNEQECKAKNYAKRRGQDLRDVVSEADKTRRSCHNALIASVDIVNRICTAHEFPLLYDGGNERREYADFALRLVEEIFTQRS